MIPHKAAVIVLEKAAAKLGGMPQLAAALRVRASALTGYLAGTQPVSEDIYLRAVDIVLGDPDEPASRRANESRKPGRAGQ